MDLARRFLDLDVRKGVEEGDRDREHAGRDGEHAGRDVSVHSTFCGLRGGSGKIRRDASSGRDGKENHETAGQYRPRDIRGREQ